MHRETRSPLTILALALLGAHGAAAQFDPCQPMPQSGTFTVNQAGGASTPDVGVFSDGRALVVYQTGSSPGNDDDRLGIVARYLDSSGQVQGNEFQVNTFIEQDQMNPQIAVAPSGAFVVVWVSDVSPGDMDRASIRARAYAANGSPMGSDFRVNDVAQGWQEHPRVAMNDAGFVVVWDTDEGSPGNDASGHSIQARRFDSTGAPLGGQFQVNSHVANDQDEPDIAMHSDGRFAIVWQSDTSPGNDTTRSVQVRRFSASGDPLAPDRQLNSITAQRQIEPRLAMDPSDASFLAVWRSEVSAGDDNDFSIQARGMRWNGIAATPSEFQVNLEVNDTQFDPNVANVGPKEYTVVWESEHTGNVTQSMRSVGLEGSLIGDEIDLSGSDLRPQDVSIGSNGAGVSRTVYKAAGLQDVVPVNRNGIRARRWAHPCATGQPSGCVESPTTLCLTNDRFRVTANWRTRQGDTGQGQAQELTSDTGYFWFFRPENVEMVIKVLDGCGLNQRFWVFAGGLTDVEVDIEVFDSRSQPERLLRQSPGHALRGGTGHERLRDLPLVAEPGDATQPGSTELLGRARASSRTRVRQIRGRARFPRAMPARVEVEVEAAPSASIPCILFSGFDAPALHQSTRPAGAVLPATQRVRARSENERVKQRASRCRHRLSGGDKLEAFAP